MIYSVNYEELAGQINPFVMKRYLKGNGWVLFKTKRDDISVFQYINDGQFEQVTIPNDQTMFDHSAESFLSMLGQHLSCHPQLCFPNLYQFFKTTLYDHLQS